MENLELINPNFWKNKNVLITGHTGFKGSWLCLILIVLGANVFGYSLKPQIKSLFNYLKIEKKIIKSVYGNINDKKKLSDFINKNDFSIIIHMAAQPLVLESYKKIDETISTNVIGTVNLLDALSKYKKRFIFLNITTDKVYEPHKKFYLNKENDKLFGKDPYSASKVLSDLITQSYNFFDFNNKYKKYFVARSGNVIGGGDFSENRIIPDIYKSFKNKRILKIRNPKSVRPWQHVLDPLAGYLKLIERNYNTVLIKDGYSWNFGPNFASYVDVKNLVNRVQKISSLEFNFKISNSNKYIETQILGLDSSKSKKYLGWKPYLNLNQSLVFTFKWYENFETKKYSNYDFTIKQIYNYFNLI